MVIRPRTSSVSQAARASSASGNSPTSKPALAGSSSTLTWSRTGSGRPGRTSATRRSSRVPSSTESTDWMTSKSSMARRALFDWSGPTRCHVTPVRAGTLSAASWTRFSPSVESPATTAACSRSTATVFETATSVTSAGSRPATEHASAIRPRTVSRATTNAATSEGFTSMVPVAPPPDDYFRRRKLGISRSSAS